MRQRSKRKKSEVGTRMISEADRRRVLEGVLALDRMLMELSMRLYNIPQRERLALRGHNRRLHHAFRQSQCAADRLCNAVSGRQVKLLETAHPSVGIPPLCSKQQRRSSLSAKPEV